MYPTRLARYQDIGVKGHEVFIDAASLIAARRPEVRFVIIGDEFVGNGEYRTRLEVRSERSNLSRIVFFLGHRDDVKRLTSALDVLVVPSLRESACFAAVQAALLERPVVASDVGGLPDTVVKEETGLLFTPGDAVQCAAAIETLLSNKRMRAEMGRRGRQHALATFSLHNTVTSIEGIYRAEWQRSVRR
jgi:glycosyltransferase involved in cell wall biosynthesis